MLRVLVADDDPDVRAAVEDALLGAGDQVFLAENGRQAVHAVRTMAFDVAVVDYRMPPLSGIDVLVALRKLQPACASVLLSGELNLPVVTEAINRGDISRILAKPASASTLLQTIEDAVGTRREQGQSYLAGLMGQRELERQALRECLEDKLDLALQPFVEAARHQVVGYEALLRSRHAFFAGPIELIEAAERGREIHDVSDAVFRLAGERLDRMPPGLPLFLNLHPLELEDPERFGARLVRLQAHRERVVLEITERSELSTQNGWQSSLDAARRGGFRIAVDDLGAGYSSLSALAAIKPEFMKVDMSLVRGVDRDRHKRQLLELLARFARATGATLIAEGVETRAEAETLAASGAQWLQGYLFGRPTV